MSYQFPATVTLPIAPTIAADHMRLALGWPSRQLIHSWRRRHGFPSPIRDGRASLVFVDDLAGWLIARNVRVIKL